MTYSYMCLMVVVTDPVLGGEPTPSEVEELDFPTFVAE